MNKEQIKAEIANLVCSRFINERATTPRHMILVQFESLDLLEEMESRNLIRAREERDNYLPTIGSFAILGDDHEFYHLASLAFERTILGLWSLYRSEGCSVDHTPAEFETKMNDLLSGQALNGLIPLGLYLGMEFGVLSPMKLSDDRMAVESFRVTEQVVRMRDPKPLWAERVRASREPLRPLSVPIEQLQAIAYELPEEQWLDAQSFADDGFWSLIHPAIAAEARSRFVTKHYADAVEAALKVVAQQVRARTGLTVDGADLMHQAFSPNRPYLTFQDPIPDTQRSMQQGYMEVFAGAMTGIRNPKAHGVITLDRRRTIHFIFLASLLADKIDEAIDVPATTKSP